MTLGTGNIVALICIAISIVFALVMHEATNPLWWVLLAIFAVLWWGSKAPWGRFSLGAAKLVLDAGKP
jgi:hypothetical protein